MDISKTDKETLKMPHVDRRKEEMAESNSKAIDGKAGKSTNMREEIAFILNKEWSQESKITALVNYFGETAVRRDMISFYLNSGSTWNEHED